MSSNSNASGSGGTEGTILATSSSSTTLPDGSQRIEELTKIRNPDGTVTMKKVVRNVPASMRTFTSQRPPDEVSTQKQRVLQDFEAPSDDVSEISATAGSTAAAVQPNWRPSVQEAEPIIFDASRSEDGAVPDAQVSTTVPNNFAPMNVQAPYQFAAQPYGVNNANPQFEQPQQAYSPMATVYETPQVAPVPPVAPVAPVAPVPTGQESSRADMPKRERRSCWTRARKIECGIFLILVVAAICATVGVLLSNDKPPEPNPSQQVTTVPTSPSSKVQPKTCMANKVKIEITPDSNTGVADGNDKVTWELILEDPQGILGLEEMLFSSNGPLPNSDTVVIEECLDDGRYSFFVTDSGGNGFGDGTRKPTGLGYVITSNGIVIGGTFSFSDGDAMTFTLPYLGEDEESKAGCNTDFEFAIFTNDSPDYIVWEVVDDATDIIVVHGGPYEVANGMFSHSACLPDGEFTFNLNVGPTDFSPPHFYALKVEGEALVTNGTSFGSADTRTFSLPFVSATSTTTSTEIPTTSLVTTTTSTTTTSTREKSTTSPPTDCYNVEIITSSDINTGGIDGDTTTWELYDRSNGEVLLSGGPLETNSTDTSNICLQPGRFTFNITDTGGDGFGDEEVCDYCGYFIYVEDRLVGGSVLFFDNEELTFPVPFEGDEPDPDEYDFCTSDFFVAVLTDSWPQETSWDLTDSSGEVVLSGGPFSLPSKIYTQRSCLTDADGPFKFTIYDSAGDGLMSPGFYMLFVENNELAGDGNFGSSNSTSFSVGFGPGASTTTSTSTSATTTSTPTTSTTSTTTSSSTKPTDPSWKLCHDVTIMIKTDIHAGSATKGDTVLWNLYSRETGEDVISGGPLSSNKTYWNDVCVPPGRYYTLNISDSGGDGFTEDWEKNCGEDCGYRIWVDDNYAGGAFTFGYEERFSFPVPFTKDEPDDDEFDSCVKDFYVGLLTDNWPQETSWSLTNSSGTIILSDGPFSKPGAQYSHWACLPDQEGPFEFTIYDSANDGMATGGYTLWVESKNLAEGTNFGASNSTIFTVGSSSSPSDGTSTSTTVPPIHTHTSTAPQICYDVTIYVKTDIDTGGGTKGDTTTWELYSRSTGDVILSGGPLGSNRTYVNDQCLSPGLYSFNISDSGGDGFGDEEHCNDCGYFIYVEGNLVGGSVVFFDNEETTFPVPFIKDEPDLDEFDHCTGDFLIAVNTDSWPEETSWELKDASDKVILTGGPYTKSSALYTQRSCLVDNNGPFTFTIYDTASDGIKAPGFYMLYVEGKELAGDGNFGASNSTVFTVGTGVASPMLMPQKLLDFAAAKDNSK